MIDKEFVREIIEAHLKGSDKYLVDLSMDTANRIVVEIDGDRAVSIDDCIALTKYIETKLDRDTEDYELEVGSAGISQPFKLLRQYRKNKGNEVEVLLKNGKKPTGILKDADENKVVLTVEKQVLPEGAKRKIRVEEDLTFTYDEIKYTKNRLRFK